MSFISSTKYLPYFFLQHKSFKFSQAIMYIHIFEIHDNTDKFKLHLNFK